MDYIEKSEKSLTPPERAADAEPLKQQETVKRKLSKEALVRRWAGSCACF
ncbi:MAG TPA: hypothetical protein VL485_00015 [Ktedonobacteraceae bacterium]|jgi:hypothetical protein|nr:hypothetical protein [Ktedonobacteraceae bacterium]